MNNRKIFIGISIAVVSLLTFSFSSVLAQEETKTKNPLGYYESLEKFGVEKAKEIPREEWPEIPVETRPDLCGERDTKSGYYQAGINTWSGDSWYGVQMVINGGIIENPYTGVNDKVRLTPHLCLKSSDDYIAVVLEVTDDEDELDLWTYHMYESPRFEYEGTVDIDSDYEYQMYIDSSNSFYIRYRSYPAGVWYTVRSGSMGSRDCTTSSFLEHYVQLGSPDEHGSSYWKNFLVYNSNGIGQYLDTSDCYGFDNGLPVQYDTWMSSGKLYMETWSEY